MRRPLTLLLSLLTLTLVLAACGDTDSDTSGHGNMSDSPMDGGSDSMDGGTMGSGSMGSDSMGGGMDHGESSPVADGARRIDVAATSFEFDPKEITITAGEDIAMSHPGFDAVLIPWPSGLEKETVSHGSSPEVLR